MNMVMPNAPIPPSIPTKASTEPQVLSFTKLARPQLIFGLVVTLLFFVGFGGWAALAPLVSGAAAPGVVSPDSSRRVVQHLEGGIISAIHVREGKSVKRGDPLLTLESTRQNASFSTRKKQWLRLLAQRARLEAHSSNLEEVELPLALQSPRAAGLEGFVATQNRLFETQRTTMQQQIEIQERRVEQLEEEIVSINAQNNGLLTQFTLLGEEIKDKERLLESSLIKKSDVLALRRQQASVGSEIASNRAGIARIRHSIEETRLNLLQAQAAFRDEVAEESAQVDNQIATIEQDMIASGDVLRRTEVSSPVDGTVLNIRSQTIGGVIKAGDAILDIVPVNDELIILARLSPRDIDLVHVGLEAKVHLVPFQNRHSRPLVGEVTQVAADATFDDATRETFYEIRVLVSAEEVRSREGIYLTPGMPAEVIVVTGERTMLHYLFDPVARTLRSAFVYD